MASKSEPNAHALRESAGFGIGAICLVVSLLVHTVLAPLPSFSALFKRHPRATAEVKHAALSEIPVDLIGDPSDQSAAPAEKVEPPVPSRDVSADHEGFESPAVENPRPQRPQSTPGQASTGAKARASGPRLDVSARASSNSSYVLAQSLVKDCSLSVLVDLSQVRAHPLAPRLGALLVQWQSLFSEPGLDPVRDVDRLLVIGSELRASGRGLAVVQHHLGGAQIRAALDRLRATAPSAPAQEQFYVQLSPELLLVAPDRESLLPRGDFALAAPSEGTIGTLYVDAPSRALRDVPIELPASIHWLRGIIRPTADNGIAVDIEAGDESIELAKRDARQLTRSVLSLKTKDHTRFIDRALFEARDSVVVGRLDVTSFQIGALLEILSDLVKAPPEPPPPPEPATSEGDEPEAEPPAAPHEAPQTPEARTSDAGVSQADASAHLDGGN
ncbi:MAG TPA: hypothetical protein VIK01_17100 [Polyangiaceae bacterium]